MSYEEFKTEIRNGQSLDNYYELILQHAHPILVDIALTSRQEVAGHLGMSYMKLTHMLPLLKILSTREN